MANTFPATGNAGAGTASPVSPLQVVGTFTKTDPTYTSSMTISHSANDTIVFNSSAIGTLMTFGPLNTVDFGNQTLTSSVRGAQFGATVGGSYALGTTNGHVKLNQSVGTRTLVGANIIDDGSTQFQVNGGILGTTIKLTTGAGAGKVLTSDASGNGSWQTASGGGTSGTFTPTLTNTLNAGSLTLGHATYMQIGNIVIVSIGGSFIPTTANVATNFTLTLPVTPISGAQNAIGTGSLGDTPGGAANYKGIIASLNGSTTTATLYMTAASATATSFNAIFQYRIN